MAITLNTSIGLGKIAILKNIVIQSIDRGVLPFMSYLISFRTDFSFWYSCLSPS